MVKGKYVDACMYFNYLNDGYGFSGRVGVSDNGWIRYREVLNTDGLKVEGQMIDNMLKSGRSLFTSHIESIAAVAVTGKRVDEVLAEYEKKAAMKAARNSGN